MKLLMSLCLMVAPAGLAGPLTIPGLARGTIGDAKVLLLLELKDAHHVTGQYGYDGRGGELLLEGTVNDTELQLTERAQVKGPVTGRFKALSLETGHGTWQSPDGKRTLPVALESEGDDDSTARLLYANLRTWKVVREKTGVVLSSGRVRVTIEEWTGTILDRTESVKMARLQGVPPEVARRVHESLESFMPIPSCSDAIRRGVELGFEYDVSYDLLSPRVLTFELYMTGYCGGAFPLAHEGDTIYFDLATGETLAGRELFADLDRDGDRLLALVHEAGTSGRAAAECERADPAHWDLSDLTSSTQHFGDQGVSFSANFPHALAVCNGVWTKPIPWAKLKPFLSPVLFP